MMCVLREIKQHIVNGVLMKDMFKMVYVAPMKVDTSSHRTLASPRLDSDRSRVGLPGSAISLLRGAWLNFALFFMCAVSRSSLFP